MTIPSITTKTWTGQAGEYFTFEDMARIEGNLNIMADYYGVPSQTFRTPTRGGLFYYDDAQKIEDTIRLIADNMGWALPYGSWQAGKSLTWMDYQRIESNLAYLRDHADELDGKAFIRLESPIILPEWTWEVRDAGNNLVDSGTGINATTYVMAPLGGAYTLTVGAMSITSSASISLQDHTTYNMGQLYTEVTISSNVTFGGLLFNNAPIAAGGTSVSFHCPRTATSCLVQLQNMVNDSQTMTYITQKVGSQPSETITTRIWELGAGTGYIVPNSASVSAEIDPPKIGNVLLMTKTGTLTIPVNATFEIWTVGGGERGHEGSTGGYGGIGGAGGEIKRDETIMSATDYTVKIGAKNGGDTTLSGGSLSITAQGGESRLRSIVFGRGVEMVTGGAAGGAPVGGMNKKSNGGDALGEFCGGSGAGGQTTNSTPTGGAGTTYGGAGGGQNENGSDGTIINGQGYGGKYLGTASPGKSAGGGGGGYGANGGNGYDGGGGGGGVLGGSGGDGGDYNDSVGGGRGGLGYGAGGGGGASYRDNDDGTVRNTKGGPGGGGGGFGTVALAEDGRLRWGGAGAPGCIQIKYIQT